MEGAHTHTIGHRAASDGTGGSSLVRFRNPSSVGFSIACVSHTTPHKYEKRGLAKKESP